MDEKFDVMAYWQGLIIGIQGHACGETFYNFTAKIPLKYPEVPPIIRFSTKIVLPCIDQKGYVIVNSIPNFKWDEHKNIANVLMAIRDAMKDKNSIRASVALQGQVFYKEFTGDEIDKNFQ